MAQQLVALGWACFRPHPLLHYSPSLSAPCSPLLVECYRAMAHYASCHLFSHNGHFGCSIMPPTAAQWARLRSPFRQWQLAKIALLSGSWSAAAPSLSLPIFTLYDCHNFGYFSRHSLRLPLCGYQCVLLPLQPRIVLHCLHCSNLWSRRPVLVLSSSISICGWKFCVWNMQMWRELSVICLLCRRETDVVAGETGDVQTAFFWACKGFS